MRTTVAIEDAVFRRAKAHAAEAGVTLSQLVTRALTEHLEEPSVVDPPFRTLRWGGGPPRALTPEDIRTALEDDDVERFGQPG